MNIVCNEEKGNRDYEFADPDEIRDDNHQIVSEDMELLVLSHILTDSDLLRVATEILPERPYWRTDDNEHGNVYASIYKVARDYYLEHKQSPSKEVFLSELRQRYGDKPHWIYLAGLVNSCYDYMFHREHSWVRKQIVDLAKSSAYRTLMKNLEQSLQGKTSLDEAKADFDLEWTRIGNCAVSETDIECFDAIEYLDYVENQPRRYLLGDWLAEGSVHLFSAQKKIGKSTCVMSMLPPLVSGRDWMDKVHAEQTTILYLDWENPADYVTGNLAAQFSRGEWEEYRKRLYVPKKLPAYLGVKWLTQWHDHYEIAGPMVLVIDSAYAAFGGQFSSRNSAWENNGSDVRSILDPLTTWSREHNAAVILIHHHNKQGDTTGSAQWEGGVDYVWSYEVHGSNRRLSAKHGRWLGEKPRSLIFAYRNKLELVGTDKEVYQSEVAGKATDDRTKLLTHIPQHELGQGAIPAEENTVTQKELMGLTGFSRNKVSDLLDDLVSNQRVVSIKIGSASASNPNRYYSIPSLAV